jgi:hypothetical protein
MKRSKNPGIDRLEAAIPQSRAAEKGVAEDVAA